MIMASKNEIKTFIVEEDNEVFFIWNYASKNNFIGAENNVLLHFDEHLDMSAPRVKTSIFEIQGDPEKLLNFTYNELAINSYIIPAIFLGFFDNIYWINHYNNQNNAMQSQKRCVRTFNNEGKKFLIYNPKIRPYNSNFTNKKFKVSRTTIDDLSLNGSNKVVLDINLNYFACINDPAEYKVNYIEITENEYKEYKRDHRYHSLKYELLGHRIEVKEEKGKYYYVINDHNEIYSYRRKRPNDEIIELIKTFVGRIQQLKIEPQLITITRSVKSGYTPEEQAGFIEQELLDRFDQLYNIKQHHIDEITSITN